MAHPLFPLSRSLNLEWFRIDERTVSTMYPYPLEGREWTGERDRSKLIYDSFSPLFLAHLPFPFGRLDSRFIQSISLSLCGPLFPTGTPLQESVVFPSLSPIHLHSLRSLYWSTYLDGWIETERLAVLIGGMASSSPFYEHFSFSWLPPLVHDSEQWSSSPNRTKQRPLPPNSIIFIRLRSSIRLK